MEPKKYIFEIDHAGEHETVRFSIDANTEENAIKFAMQLNPSAKLKRVDNPVNVDDIPNSPFIW